MDEASQQELRHQVPSGATRLQLPCPFPEVVDNGRDATAKQEPPRAPKVVLLESKHLPDGAASSSDRQQVATLLGLPEAQGPSVRLPSCPRRQTPQGALLGRCPKGPSDLEAKGGSHVDNKNPARKEAVFGYVHLSTTALHRALGRELPLGHSTSPADAQEGTKVIEHRTTLAVPVLPGQVPLGDAAHDVTANYLGLHDQGGIAVCDYHPRNEPLDAASLVNRGSDQDSTPSAPCGRLCRSHGYDYQANSRQYGWGRPCPPEEQRHCPHRFGVLGSSQRLTFKDHPRLIGPSQRGTPADLPCPFWRKANSFRGLVAFLLHYVATIKLANTKLYLDIIL